MAIHVSWREADGRANMVAHGTVTRRRVPVPEDVRECHGEGGGATAVHADVVNDKRLCRGRMKGWMLMMMMM